MKNDKERVDALDTEHMIELTPADLQYISQTALRTLLLWTAVGLVCGGLLYYTFYMLRAFEPAWLYPWREYFIYFYLVGWVAAGAVTGYKLGILKIARYLVQHVNVTQLLMRRIFSHIVTGAVKLRTREKEIKDFTQLDSKLSIEHADRLLTETLREYRKKDFNWRTGKGLVKRVRKLVLSRVKKFLVFHAAFFLLDEFQEEYHESLGVGVQLSHVEERASHLLDQYLRERIAGLFSRRPAVIFGFATLLSILLPLVNRILDAVYISQNETARAMVNALRGMFPHIPLIVSVAIPCVVLAIILIVKKMLVQKKVLP
jgi:hypothetical protein